MPEHFGGMGDIPLLADFEGLESRFHQAISSPQYEKLLHKLRSVNKIYVVGNGGLHYVGSHMATDLTRLIPGKVVKSFDSFGFITSNANDYGWENTFVRWLETSAILDNPDTTMLYGLSCSGNSKNVINALQYADTELGFQTFLLSGKPCKSRPINTLELALNVKYYHTVETIAMMLFYDIVHKMGHSCPLINS